MDPIVWILESTFLISLLAFVGVFAFYLKEELLNKVLLVLVAFSVGSSIGGAFLHLMPEAIMMVGLNEVSILNTFLFLLLGFCVFFVLEQLIRWHHHHATTHPKIMPFSYMILVSDGLHNFIDGMVIGASFLINFHMGIVTFLVIALHEIPQEIGDFGVLIYGGFEKGKALILNYISAATIIFGGITSYLISNWIGRSIVFLLPFAAGNFVYIAAVDLIPEIRFRESLKKTLIRFFVFMTGISLMLIIKYV
jgi:zinc and cadmium transporter